MSLILDALRKLDREKSSRRRGGPDIASEILRDGPASARGKGYRYAAAFSLTALLAAGLTYALLAGIGLPGKKLPPEHPLPPAPNQADLAAPEKPVLSAKIPSSESAVPPVLRKQPPAAPASSAPRGKASTSEGGEPASLPKQPPEISPGAETGEKPSSPFVAPSPATPRKTSPAPSSPDPARAPRTEPDRTPAKVSEAAAPKPPEASPGGKSPGQAVLSPGTESARGEAGKPGTRPAGEGPATPPPLKITGIVWNEEPSKRRAVVNGSFVTEGSTIEGVKVVEIEPTQVRFQYRGQIFQISVF